MYTCSLSQRLRPGSRALVHAPPRVEPQAVFLGRQPGCTWSRGIFSLLGTVSST